jgi:hypothetical protein
VASDPRPRDDRDVVNDTARDLAEIAAHIGQLKGDANAYLNDLNYNTLRLRLEHAHAAVEAATVEARRRVRLNEGGPAPLKAYEGLPFTRPSSLPLLLSQSSKVGLLDFSSLRSITHKSTRSGWYWTTSRLTVAPPSTRASRRRSHATWLEGSSLFTLRFTAHA